ncbi:hypothetical protein I204_00902 [Kwoniella mangroviensis CBS 8886]|uniref:uncharacterized protein n=1 Tax=Kwoniella mangroviensis CBS 8507 TaxID=1296122 RepID=UPI00080D6E0B|nr:uncharacterized protein I203_05859 [Kwoniella mangroviensis CBS 8507]OCF65117.1 hypothetical protein I203_05859 [Kwoniella mangroviensis CBS 8507]OCF78958.1 hypothetical protein I204_00902 [Kwoniella mangroviensis CBS 8886]
MPWLMKAEPDSRIVKGKDVKFSVDDFEKIGTSPWDGVRNHEAKKIMKERMKLGDQVLFYHSNCKVPGVFAIAEIAKEGYPDYTAWDPKHPYHDPKSKEDDPTWYMVDVGFIRRLAHPPTLQLIKHLATLSPSSALPKEISYIGKDGLEAIRSMQLVNRGRLSVQPVEQLAFESIVKLGQHGGWEDLIDQKQKGKSKSSTPAMKKSKGDADAIQKPKPSVTTDSTKKERPASVTKRSEPPSKKGAKQRDPPSGGSQGERRSKRIKVN